MAPRHISAPHDLLPPLSHEFCVSASLPCLTLFSLPGTPILPHPPTARQLPCLHLVAFPTVQPPGPVFSSLLLCCQSGLFINQHNVVLGVWTVAADLAPELTSSVTLRQ